ncbi:hypothetical protein HHK36_017152 [Tetracentron sinense]|uniref:protein-tyrosine-phosphatase n=1 Tax=Tetracentron sinense TaxID=13715 RepID=A0A834Z6M8_TETSI|nr:hypothetical protein HHK36_017152 [Tetracentron sinense]
MLISASSSFFSEWKPRLTIPTKEIRKVSVGGSVIGSSFGDDAGESSEKLPPEKLLYSLEYAGKDLKLVRMAVPLRDMESENLLDYLDVCLDFIDESRKKGSILVHFFADALESLRQSCEYVCPNDGFLEQLKMFEDIGFKVDTASPKYKRFCLKVFGHSYKDGEKMDSSKFGADPGLTTEAISSEVAATPNGGTNHNPAYRCKKCRRVVALQESVVGHTPGEGETGFEWSKRKGGNPFSRSDELECSSIFVLPLRWMKTVNALVSAVICLDLILVLSKMVHCKASCHVPIVMHAWVTSTGQASSAAAGPGSPRPFSFIKAESTSVLSKHCTS